MDMDNDITLNSIMRKTKKSKHRQYRYYKYKKCKLCGIKLLNNKNRFCSNKCKIEYYKIEHDENEREVLLKNIKKSHSSDSEKMTEKELILIEKHNIIKSTRIGYVDNKLKEMRIKQTETHPSVPRISKVKNRHPLKPWQDPESLFCDTEFLKKFLGKEPLKGEECREKEKN